MSRNQQLPDPEKKVSTRTRKTVSRISTGILLGCIFLASCDIGPKHVVPVVTEAPALTEPPDGSVDQQNALYLEWTELAEANSYHVQVSRMSDFDSLTVDQRNIQDPIAPVKELEIDSTYYWRVRALNEAGFSDWSLTWSFMSSSAARLPSATALLYPPDGTGDLGTQVDFIWSSTPDARFYHLEASLEDDFYSREADMIVSDTLQTVTALVYEYWYYWRVRGQNAVGYGPWSETWLIVIAAAG